MTSKISLEGLMSDPGGDNRALALLKVDYNGQTYDWQIYIDRGVDLSEFIGNCNAQIEAQIDAKEQEWAELDPKTRTITDPLSNEERTIPIDKSEIVRPDIPDYKAQRRQAYPDVGDQLDAVWKGYATKHFTDMQMLIYDTKIQFPKGASKSDKLESIRADTWNKVIALRQRVIEGGAAVTVDGVEKWFNSDAFSRTQWLGMMLLGPTLPPGISWRTMDGTLVTLTPGLVQQVFSAIMTKEVLAFGHGTALYQEIMASNDPTTIDIQQGWPDSYQ